MKTIYQSQDVAFHAPTLKDAVVLLPLMNELTHLVNINRVVDVYNNQPKEEREKYRRPWAKTSIEVDVQAAEKMLQLLHDFGFEAQIELKSASHDDLELK